MAPTQTTDPFHRALGHPATIIYGLFPATVQSVLLPKAARGVEEHERIVNGSIPDMGIEHVADRFIGTIDFLLAIEFGGTESETVANAVHELHRTVEGSMPDGSRYHAWNRDVWVNTWVVQVRGFMDSYGALVGFESPEERRLVYEGFVAMGERFRVSGMPSTLEEFDTRWQDLVETTLKASDPARFLVELTTPNVPMPSNARWLPRPLWALLTLPLRRIGRVGILCAVPQQLDVDLGITRSWIDRVEFRLHRAVWRIVPPRVACRFGPACVRSRRARGTPPWRTRYSATALEARRRSRRAGPASGVGAADALGSAVAAPATPLADCDETTTATNPTPTKPV